MRKWRKSLPKKNKLPEPALPAPLEPVFIPKSLQPTCEISTVSPLDQTIDQLPSEFNSSFTPVSKVGRGYMWTLRRVWIVFFAQATAVSVWTAIAGNNEAVLEFMREYYWLVVCSTGAMLAVLLLLKFHSLVFSLFPESVCLLCIFTIAEVYTISSLLIFVQWQLILEVSVIYACMFSGLAIYTLTVNKGVSKKGNFTSLLLGAFTGFGVVFSFSGVKLLPAALSFLVVAITGSYVVIDIDKEICSRTTQGDVVLTVMRVYMDCFCCYRCFSAVLKAVRK